jgi:hypothetical protein
MDSWKIFCAKYRTRKQKLLVEQREERLALLQKHKAELESMEQVHKEALEELKELFEKDRIHRKQLLEKNSKKASVVSLKKRKREIAYVAENLTENESENDENIQLSKSKAQHPRNGSITKYFRKKLTRAANSIELIKNKAKTDYQEDFDISFTQPCIKFCEMIKTKADSSDEEDICRTIPDSE